MLQMCFSDNGLGPSVSSSAFACPILPYGRVLLSSHHYSNKFLYDPRNSAQVNK